MARLFDDEAVDDGPPLEGLGESGGAGVLAAQEVRVLTMLTIGGCFGGNKMCNG